MRSRHDGMGDSPASGGYGGNPGGGCHQSRSLQPINFGRYDHSELYANLSSFYRDRFGSHSPEEYTNLRLSRFDNQIAKDEMKYILNREFRRFVPFEIREVRCSDNQRLVYVNFEHPDAPRTIRHTMFHRLQKLLGKGLRLDPAGIIRDQEGKFIPDRYNRALLEEKEQERKEPIRKSASRGGGGRRERNNSGSGTWNLKENDSDATRTLFVGNMPANIRESEIRRVFERYGKVEDVDIKKPLDINAAYAFVLFQTLEQAVNAKAGEHDRPIRHGSSGCKIGYGKSQPSNRLWIGGLGPWISAECLSKDFGRFGLIDRLEYDEGSDFAYIRFADHSSAIDARRAMKGFPLGGRDRCITVDFAQDDVKKDRKRHRSVPDELSPKRKEPRTSPESSAGAHSDGEIDTINELECRIAPTWQGFIILKKSEYAIRLHRISGTEHLLQKLLRDPTDGSALKLHITQRVPLANQEALEERLLNSSKKQLSLMIAVACDKPIWSLVNYLCEKQAAGVVTVPGGVLYVFAASKIADRLIDGCARGVKVLTPECGHLLFALVVKAPSDTPST